jgi:hypothetical protein
MAPGRLPHAALLYRYSYLSFVHKLSVSGILETFEFLCSRFTLVGVFGN